MADRMLLWVLFFQSLLTFLSLFYSVLPYLWMRWYRFSVWLNGFPFVCPWVPWPCPFHVLDLIYPIFYLVYMGVSDLDQIDHSLYLRFTCLPQLVPSVWLLPTSWPIFNSSWYAAMFVFPSFVNVTRQNSRSYNPVESVPCSPSDIRYGR